MQLFKMLLTIVTMNLISFISYGQDIEKEKSTVVPKGIPSVESTLYKINFWYPGFGYEYGLSNNFSLAFDLSLVPFGGFSGDGDDWITEYNLSVGGFLRSQLRYYYNLKNRQELGRNTSGNSGNYFALHLAASQRLFWIHKGESIVSGVSKISYISGITWGLQRSYKNNIFINFELGLEGFYTNGNESQLGVAPHVYFRVGYLLFRNKNK